MLPASERKHDVGPLPVLSDLSRTLSDGGAQRLRVTQKLALPATNRTSHETYPTTTTKNGNPKTNKKKRLRIRKSSQQRTEEAVAAVLTLSQRVRNQKNEPTVFSDTVYIIHVGVKFERGKLSPKLRQRSEDRHQEA